MFPTVLVFIIFFSSPIKGEEIIDPTIKPTPNFIVSSDAGFLKKQLKEGDMDNDKVANLIFHRTFDERKQIENYYNEEYCAYINRHGQKVYSVPLLDGLQNNSMDSMVSLYECMFTPPEQILAIAVHETIDGNNEDQRVVEETICAQENKMKDLIAKYYQQKYQVKFEDHFKKYKPENQAYQEAILKYCWPPRSQTLGITDQVAADEAKVLQQINVDSDKENFKCKLKEFLGKYSEADLKLIFQKYQTDKHCIDGAVDKAFEGDEKFAYGTLVSYIENTCKYYADALHHAVEDGTFKTDIDRINRITVTRSEKDMLCIANEYKKIHDETFTQRLKSDVLTEPRYLECIRYLCGKP